MAYSLTTNTAAASTDTVAVSTTPVNTTGANLIVLVIADYVGFGASPTPTDNQSNTWTGLTAQTAAGSTHCRIWYVYNPTTSTTHTFTSPDTGQARYPVILMAAFSGAVASPADQQNGSTGTGTSLATGSITPSEGEELIISGISFGATGGATVNESMTETNDIGYNLGVNMGGVMAYKIQTTATAINPTWTYGSSEGAAVVASFKDTPGGLGRLLLRTPA